MKDQLKKNEQDPPRWAISFLEWFCPDELTESILGDLYEQFDMDRNNISTKKAKRRFVWNTLRFFHPSILLRNHFSLKNFINMSMLKNYFKVGFRSIKKQKMTTAINVFGLTLGIVCAGLAYLFIQHEMSFDKFHTEHESMYSMTTLFRGEITFVSTPAPLAPSLVAEIPEVTEGIRLDGSKILVESKNELFNEEAIFTDENFFSFFDFKLLEGKKENVFNNINTVVLNETMARKYFGRQNPIGKTISLHINEEKSDFVVTGVAEDPPKNSSIQYEFVLPLRNLYKDKLDDYNSQWDKFPINTFIRLKNKNDIASLEKKLPEFIAQKFQTDQTEEKDGPESKTTFKLLPFNNFHFNGNSNMGMAAVGDMKNVKRLGWIGWLILLVACLNFMNLSNAKNSNRLTEVGVRKVMGAKTGQLRKQFLVESLIISFFAFLFSILIIRLSLPYIEQITEYELPFEWWKPSVFLPLVGITLGAGFMAGLYPSFLFSRLKTVETFRSNLKIGGNNWATKGSLVFQFALSVGLLSCTFIMFQQQNYIKNKNLGFNKEEVVVIPLQIDYNEKEKAKPIIDQFKQEISRSTNVQQVSRISWSFGNGNEVVFLQEEDGGSSLIFLYRVDEDFIPMMNMEMVAGRNFRSKEKATSSRSIIVNEAFIKEFEIENIEGYRLPEKFQDYANTSIVGVIKDFHFANLKQKIQPMIMTAEDGFVGNILVKIKPDNVETTLAELKTAWKKVEPNKAFSFSFLDDDIQKQYISESRWNTVFTGATILAILISCLGLFGLIALTLAERTKEIGIRKILGASIFDITWLVSRQFVMLQLIAAVIAIPIVWYGMIDWLNGFAYQVGIQWFVFVLAICLTTFLALLTSSIQAIKAASNDPVEALK